MSVLTLQQAKDYLNIEVETYDVELQTFIDSAEAAIAKRCGPLASTAVTKIVDGRGWALSLPCTPVLSLTSVTGNTGDVISVSDLTVLPPGVVRYTTGGAWFPSYWYTVVYNAGRTTCPSDLLLAVKKLLKSSPFWNSQRGAPMRASDVTETQGPGFLLPYEVLELMAPHLQPGFS